jgi:heme exporter protein A
VTALRAEGLAIVRGGRLLVEGLDFQLHAGDGLVLTGPNGAGKSSLLRCLAGLLAPAAGRVSAGGALALADERLPLDPELPLERALRFWARFDPEHADVHGALADLALEGLAEVPVRMLSSGQRKRAALGLVRMSGAPIWLLDEPLNALDDASIERLQAMIARHRAGGGVVVVATHQPLGGGDWARLELGS